MLVMLALRSGSGTHVPVFTLVRLMLVMMALRPGSGMLWPEEGRLMLLMPAFQPVSEIFATRGTADAHDACLEPAELHVLSQEVQLLLVMLVLRPQSAIHWPRELRLMLLMPVCTPVSDIHN